MIDTAQARKLFDQTSAEVDQLNAALRATEIGVRPMLPHLDQDLSEAVTTASAIAVAIGSRMNALRTQVGQAIEGANDARDLASLIMMLPRAIGLLGPHDEAIVRLALTIKNGRDPRKAA